MNIMPIFSKVFASFLGLIFFVKSDIQKMLEKKNRRW
jgi:hypothetical protein